MTERKRVIFAINDLLIGGAQRLFIELANRMQATGKYEIAIVVFFSFKEKENFVQHIRDDISVNYVRFRAFYDVFAWWRYVRLLKSFSPDSIFSTLFFSNFVTRAISLFFGPKILVVEQNTYDTKHPLFVFLDKILSFITPQVICTSETVAKFTADQLRIGEEKFRVIHSGVDIDALLSRVSGKTKADIRREIGIPLQSFVFLSLARLTPQKNPELLIRSFAEFLSNNKDKRSYVLLMVGGGSIRGELEAFTRSLSIEGNVIFAGMVHDVWNYYAASDVFVSTSRIEGFSLVHAEAMAFGLPLVSTRTAGPDVMLVPSKNGFFVDSTVDSVVRGLQLITEVPFVEYSHFSKLRAKEFAIDKTLSQYESLISA